MTEHPRDDRGRWTPGEDIRGALRQERHPLYHRATFDRSMRFLWRFTFFCLGLAVFGAIARLFS